MKRWNIHRQPHFSQEYNGPDCNLILENARFLTDLLREDLRIYGEVLMAFNEVRLSCFGDRLKQDYRLKINEFEESFRKLGMPVFFTAHVVFHHVADFVDEYGPLGPWSEQSFEAIHYKWMEFWEQSYKRKTEAPDYAAQLLKAVVDFNTLAI